jgi:membrane protein YdbS with pleckstrin-like domain
MAIFFSTVPGLGGSSGNKIISILLVLVASISYASLLYPFKYKPYFLNNSFPALFLILIAVTCFYFLQVRYTADKHGLDKQIAT